MYERNSSPDDQIPAGLLGVMALDRVEILGIPIDKVTMDEAIRKVAAFIESGRPHLVVTPNPEIVYASRTDPELRQLLRAASLSVPDGAGIVWASRYLGDPVPERVAGIDLMAGLLELSSRRGFRVFLLGSGPGVAEEAARRLQKAYPGLSVVGVQHGYFRPEEEDRVIEAIRAARPHILLVGMGAPKQEIWLARNLERLGVPVCLGVGGSLDVWAGRARRAPPWMRRANLEWLYRLYREPRRATRMLALPRFAWAVVREGIGRWLKKGGED